MFQYAVMLDETDPKTGFSLRQLDEVLKKANKPLLFWVGAGASKWCGFPLWSELADKFHSNFLKTEQKYDSKNASELITHGHFPRFFEYCKNTNLKKYHQLLTNFVNTKPVTPVYRRFLNNLQSVPGPYIVTTNIDELLEKNLTQACTVQSSDIERCHQLLTEGRSFVCKLHGSISSIDSVVFSQSEYVELTNRRNFVESLRQLFSLTHVVFVGYGLGDAYVLESMQQSEQMNDLFGDGPHFGIVDNDASVPEFVHPIRYEPIPHRDHRSALIVLDEIRMALNGEKKGIFESELQNKPTKLKSAHLLSNLIVGTVTTSQTVTLGNGAAMKVGTGLVDSELPFKVSTAMHDILVGLLCFDEIYTSIHSLGIIHRLLGGDLTMELIRNGILRFLHWELMTCVFFEDKASMDFGELMAPRFEEEPSINIDRRIRSQLKSLPGREADAEKEFELILETTTFITMKTEPNVIGLTKSGLLRPSIRSLIGMSGGMPMKRLPPWMHFPVLRLAEVVRIGAACNALGIASAKLEYGSAKLAGPAFAAAYGTNWADETASYVLSAKFDTNLGEMAIRQPNLVRTILDFRLSSAGVAIREEIFDQLLVEHGGDFITSVNAGLRQAVSPKTLQDARDEFVGLLLYHGDLSDNPVIWNNYEYANKALQLWKTRSLTVLHEYCNKRRISMTDQCPCGSGEKRRYCCEESLAAPILSTATVGL